MFTYRFWHPSYHNYVTLDCFATDQVAALASAVRFIRRENRRLARFTTKRCQLPTHPNSMRPEGPATPA
jgi:hypothetical protein